ncbi:RNA 3'-terminal phosphate cyclase isoform X2 [Hippocampus zosterae]|uniref:RNA 3'-terminal phosphate cyclase isoform X2 n=1 Tax=Hippocampus zosterae TaxID=109293 RepID=UPI00223DB4A1|nr:RNA 3'-terminal phosphate cyclase isoform X2 [Hippocampus zosterae]
MESPAVELDGSFMEGGGQILRVAAALGCIGGSSVTISKIRAGRSTPGLRWRSRALSMATPPPTCASEEEPMRTWRRKSITRSRSSSPSWRSLESTLTATSKGGFYPKGGGEVTARVPAVQELRPVTLLERGAVAKIHGRAYVAGGLPFKLAEDMAASAARAIRREVRELDVNIGAVQEEEKACGNASGIIIVAESSTGCLFAGSALGKKGVRADTTGAEAAEMLLRNLRHGGCVDEFLQDQLIIFMALAKGTSRIRTGAVTRHTQTAIHVAQRMTRAKFTVSKCADTPDVTHVIECLGSGVPNPNLVRGTPSCAARTNM